MLKLLVIAIFFVFLANGGICKTQTKFLQIQITFFFVGIITFKKENNSTRVSTFEVFTTTVAQTPGLCSLLGYRKKHDRVRFGIANIGWNKIKIFTTIKECNCCNAVTYDSITSTCQIHPS